MKQLGTKKEEEKRDRKERHFSNFARPPFLPPLVRETPPNSRLSLFFSIFFFFSLHSWPQAPNSIDFSSTQLEIPHIQPSPPSNEHLAVKYEQS